MNDTLKEKDEKRSLLNDADILIKNYTRIPDEYTFDTTLAPLCKELFLRYQGFTMPRFEDIQYPRIEYEAKDVQALCFSGGKVSLACALRYKDAGKNIVLIHMATKNENTEEIEAVARKLDFPLKIIRISSKYNNSPLYHILIISEAIRYVIENKLSQNIIYGAFEYASLKDNPDTYCCKEMLQPFIKFVQKSFYRFHLAMPMPNYSIVWDELLKHPQYVPYIECTDDIERSILYIASVDHNLLEESVSSIYMKHIKKLKRSLEKEAGVSVNDVNILWNRYFFYRIEKSKHYGELMKLP